MRFLSEGPIARSACLGGIEVAIWKGMKACVLWRAGKFLFRRKTRNKGYYECAPLTWYYNSTIQSRGPNAGLQPLVGMTNAQPALLVEARMKVPMQRYHLSTCSCRIMRRLFRLCKQSGLVNDKILLNNLPSLNHLHGLSLYQPTRRMPPRPEYDVPTNSHEEWDIQSADYTDLVTRPCVVGNRTVPTHLCHARERPEEWRDAKQKYMTNASSGWSRSAGRVFSRATRWDSPLK